mmetsp:Transcript_25636/g.56536  ORF Transcript_25636/g.56536 Transcript_25636/m.56536 type:complete len:461 (+) Transcript_25636:180-1562(+)|eukprot:CAMPEP_0170597602 /NCGR_PEP_ID=MMETSP0224-20130122/15795_1 /TAXON_ID=285029 /ORGANISM="Togula jolla, Strain CCCM 725" /LENGTH=460 /DNA_ID=CAMNT_0010922085 /DNA_START=160 /DNA_END=1542 /DNA_ORIENTATION=-
MAEPEHGDRSGSSLASVRWEILLLTCGGLFGQFYAFDNPSALNEQLKFHMVSKTDTGEEEFAFLFNLLYTVYSVPNVVLPLVMGLCVDRCGCRILICALAVCVVLGHALFSAGVGATSWRMMIAGRILFGIGGESMQVAQNCLLFRWFKGHEVAFALGLNLSIARAGSVMNDIVSPWVAENYGLEGAMWLGMALCMASAACNFRSAVLDKFAGEREGLPEAINDEEVYVSQIFQFPRLFWLLTALCVVLYCAILPFNNIASAFFVETWFRDDTLSVAQQRAGNAMSIMFLVSALGTPPFGALVDLWGMRTRFLLGSSLLLTLTYSTISVLPPTVSMLGLGLVYTVFAGALWPTFALTVPQKQLGTAYGVAVALQNLGLALTPMLVGHMQAVAGFGNFNSVIRLFAAFGVISTGLNLMIVYTNQTSHGVLDLPSVEAEGAGVDKLGEHTWLWETPATKSPA